MQKIVQKMKTRYNIIRKIAMTVCALGMMAGTAWGQITFTHSQGKLATNDVGIPNTYYNYVNNLNLQQTHEYTKTVYVKAGQPKQLIPYNYASSYMNTYFRWFMYNNESDVSNLEKYLNIENLTGTVNDVANTIIYHKSNKGYLTTNILGNAQNHPTFTTSSIPAEGIKIALDVSNEDKLSITNSTNEFTEPTLAYRYIFDIQDMDTFMKRVTSNNDGYINSVRRTLFATANMFFQVRLTQPLNNYYLNNKYLSYNDIKITATKDGQAYPIADDNIYINNQDVLIIPQPEVGVYTVTISCGNYKLDEYRITFLSIRSAGMFLEEDLAAGKDYYYMSQDSLDALVNDNRAMLLGEIDFDDDTYLDHLTDHYYDWPILPWTQSSYAWMSSRDMDYASYRISTTSAKVPYRSYLNDHAFDLGAAATVYGHGGDAPDKDAFMYVNVANEPGKMLELNWNEEICSNSRMYLTFWINEFSNAESGNVELSVTGIRENGTQEAIRTYITGYVPKYSAPYRTTNEDGSITESITPDDCKPYDSTNSQTFEYQHPLYNNGTDAPQECRGRWMQVCYSFITEFDPNEYKQFVFTINNNTKNSGGGDFAIDDIRVYAVNPTVIAQQTSQCADIYEVDIRLPYEQLAYTYAADPGQKDGYFSFWENVNGRYVPVHYNYGTDENPNQNYGSFKFHTEYNQNPANEESATYPEMYRWTDDRGEQYLVFNTTPHINDLNVNEKYIVVFYSNEGEATSRIESGSLNLDEKCLIWSEFSVRRSQVVLIDGKPETDALSVCYNQRPTITPAMQIHDDVSEGEVSDNYWYEGLYDVYKGSLEEYNAKYQEAISHFRTDYPTAENPAEVEAGTTFTAADKQLLTENANKFIFYCHSFTAEYPGDIEEPTKEEVVYTIIPITPEQESEIPDEVYCWDPYEFKLTFSTEAPLVNIGFPDVEYGDYTPCLRLGLNDLGKLNAQQLTIPLQNPTSGNNITTVSTNPSVYLDLGSESTNDPKLLEYLGDITDPWCDDVLVGTIQSLTATSEGNNNALIIKLDKLGTKVTFQEGYQYGFRLQYSDGSNVCYGDLRFIIKVVPAYQFWLGSATDNWNNDENWVRAKATDMNNPSGYSDYASPYEHKGYVPMYFTKVVVPSKHKQVELYEATTTGHTVNIDIPQTAGVTERATENIEYDLMVKPATGSGYDCEPYYTNTVSEIHFEPNTEMLHTELLDYEKAWVDYELEKGRWYTLASPLQGVVAGDFYTDKKGREAQAYFSDINYDPNNNDRFNPSVYQRGWKGSATLQTLNSGPKEVAIEGNWSSVYNDVTVPYSEGAGFSLKVQDIQDGQSALFRLPKSDLTYSYFSNGNPTTGSNPKTIEGRTTDYVGKLKTDETVTLTNLNDLTVTDGKYYLVGNPYMAHIDAGKFFTANGNLLKKYWLVDGTNQTATVGSGTGEDFTTTDSKGDNTIAPLQSFFVTVAEGQTAPTSITFSRDMQVLGGTSDNLRSTDVLYLTAITPDGKQSRAALAYNLAADKDYEASEDAELFLDSNLSDVPMVYTVAGTMATSINQTSELYNIPVGVYSARATNENVSLSFSNLNGFSYATLYDAETGTDTPLHEGSSFSVPANTNGRYFLRAGVPTANEAVQENAIRIYSVGGQLVIASTDPLQQVYIYDFAGRLVDSETRLHTTRYTTDLPAGNYMVKARSVSGEKIEKFKLRN